MTRKVRRIEEARKKREAKKRPPRKPAHWYELVEYFEPEAIKRVRLPETQGYRTFHHGTIDDMLIVEVDKEMPNALVQEFGEALAKSGLKAFIVSNNVRFLRLRRVSAEESELLDDVDENDRGTLYAPDTRNGSEPDGDGAGSARREPHAGVVRGDQDDAEGTDAGSSEEDRSADSESSD
jgi:hypothetical protein